jgi:hypothetical protein
VPFKFFISRGSGRQPMTFQHRTVSNTLRSLISTFPNKKFLHHE